MRAWPSIRRFATERLTVGLLALALAALAVVPGGTSESPCGEPREASMPRAAVKPDEPTRPTGIDLEVRVLNLRIEFPWMRALPISPGHHIVISLLAREGGEARP